MSFTVELYTQGTYILLPQAYTAQIIKRFPKIQHKSCNYFFFVWSQISWYQLFNLKNSQGKLKKKTSQC